MLSKEFRKKKKHLKTEYRVIIFEVSPASSFSSPFFSSSSLSSFSSSLLLSFSLHTHNHTHVCITLRTFVMLKMLFVIYKLINNYLCASSLNKCPFLSILMHYQENLKSSKLINRNSSCSHKYNHL